MTTNSRYHQRIKVVCEDRMCFPVDPHTLEATGVSVYDAYAVMDPDPIPLETISHTEWLERTRRRYGKGDHHTAS